MLYPHLNILEVRSSQKPHEKLLQEFHVTCLQYNQIPSMFESRESPHKMLLGVEWVASDELE